MQGIDDSGAGGLDLNGANGEETFIRIAAAAHELGFEFCTHGLRFAIPVTRPRTTFLSTYPPEWLARYGERGYVDIDPTVAHGMRSSEPVVWSDELFAATPDLWREARAHGIRHGWAISKRDADGTFSMLVLARSEHPITQAELQASEWRMRQLAEMSHVAMKAHMAEDLPADPMLSGREIEVLRWTADGKTASEIADILGISERTVNFHINQSVSKLGANNKVNAAVRAAMRGLLW